MRVWLCLLAIGLLVGCHHRPPTIIDEDKATVHPVIPELQNNNNIENKKVEDSNLQEGTLNDKLGQLRPVFFDYDKSDIRSDQMEVLQRDAQILKTDQ